MAKRLAQRTFCCQQIGFDERRAQMIGRELQGSISRCVCSGVVIKVLPGDGE